MVYDGKPPVNTATTGDAFYIRLEKFLEMPIELFAESCTFLAPQDLRNLSFAGHAFRNTLMSRESRPIWATSRVRTYGPMPDPPSGMSEPQYARFLFDPQCYTCNDVATGIDHFNQIKSCEDCYKKYHLTQVEAEALYPGLALQFIRTPLKSNRPNAKRPYYRSKLDPEFNLYLSQVSNGGSQSQADFEAKLEERCSNHVKSGKAIAKWMKIEYDRHEGELDVLYEKRDNSIYARMYKQGHPPEEVDLEVAEEFGLRFLPWDMTEEEWIVMRSELVEDAICNYKERDRRMDKPGFRAERFAGGLYIDVDEYIESSSDEGSSEAYSE